MERLSKGSVVLVTFPFSDLSASKLRPAVVLASAEKNDWILCQITSNPYSDIRAVQLVDLDFHHGSLRKISFARPGKIFTANESLIRSQVGQLKSDSWKKVQTAVLKLFQS